MHLYVHVPFCDGKCSYCGFYSVPREAGRVGRYLDALERELALRVPVGAGAGGSVYLGGGTPGVLEPGELERLCALLCDRAGAARAVEWSVELNPATVTPERLRVLRTAGVSRVTLGVQALDDAVLRAIGRRHTAADACRAWEEIRLAGFARAGVDLMACLPGVEAAGWRRTLQDVAGWGPDHVSVYVLGMDPGSALSAAGCLPPTDGAALEAMAEAGSVLEVAGIRRYEISNFAVPGGESVHNLNCWRGGDYTGLGPGACSRNGLTRRANAADVDAYVTALSGGGGPPGEVEDLQPPEDGLERLVFGLRLVNGIRPVHGAEAPWRADVERAWRGVVSQGLALMERDGRWRLTARGLDVADGVISELWAVGRRDAAPAPAPSRDK